MWNATDVLFNRIPWCSRPRGRHRIQKRCAYGSRRRSRRKSVRVYLGGLKQSEKGGRHGCIGRWRYIVWRPQTSTPGLAVVNLELRVRLHACVVYPVASGSLQRVRRNVSSVQKTSPQTSPDPSRVHLGCTAPLWRRFQQAIEPVTCQPARVAMGVLRGERKTGAASPPHRAQDGSSYGTEYICTLHACTHARVAYIRSKRRL